MKLLLVDNIHIKKTTAGEYYTPSIYDDNFFERYLKVFDTIKVVCKTRKVNDINTKENIRIKNPKIEFCELPWYQGTKHLIKKILKVKKVLRNATDDCDCIIYRVAQIESFITYIFKKNKKLPYAVEVVNDPATFDGFFVRNISIFFTKRMTKKAYGASYVTRDYLQKKYPLNNQNNKRKGKVFLSYYSSIELYETDIKEAKKYESKSVMNICHVGNAIYDNTKGQTTLLKICKCLKDNGSKVVVHFIGDGPYIKILKQKASFMEIEKSVVFHGRFPNKKDVLSALEKMDIFVYPTHMEGLPRVVIEAMAVGLPVLSTDIAGIPELLESKYIFKPDDVYSFVFKLEQLMNKPSELEAMSLKNTIIAKKFVNTNLEPRRTIFYTKLYDTVEETE